MVKRYRRERERERAFDQ